METAGRMVAPDPRRQISISDIARELNVKPASLYNHIGSIDEIRVEVGLYAVKTLVLKMETAISGKGREAALFALAEAYRNYEHENPGLYFYIMHLPRAEDLRLREAAALIVRPILAVMTDFGLTQAQCHHWQRILRSMMHGFTTQERHGYFTAVAESPEDSYRLGIECVLAGIQSAVRNQERSAEIR